MTHEEFQREFEKAAQKTKDECDQLPVSALIAKLKRGDFDRYHTIWQSLAQRAKPEDVAWILFDILDSDEDYIARFHAASALISIMGCATDGFRPEMLSARNCYPVEQNLEKLRLLLEKKLGERLNQ